MKKVIHLSDLHVGFKDLGKRYRQIINGLISEKGDHADKYVIVITGDLVENAHHQGDYAEVQSGLDDLKQAGFKDILIIPGNHDYGTGKRSNKKFVKIFQETVFGKIKGYPRKDIIEDIAFIGLDSMAEELHWYDMLWSEGELGDQQLGRLNAILEEDEVRSCKKRVVYLHHHPFDPRPLHQLKDSKKLRKVLKAAIAKGISIDALLYGHNHQGKAHNGRWGIPRCYDAGSTTEKSRPKVIRKLPVFKAKSFIRVIDFENEDTCL